MYDVLIIGCGIVGAALSYELSKFELAVAIVEKDNDVANATSKANSAIIHAGYDPEPGTLMAKLNVEGSSMAKKLCTDLDVPYKQIGSLVLAFDKEELPLLEELYERGVTNGVPDMKLLDGEAVKKLEPNVNPDVRAGLYAASTAIVSPWEYALAMAETAVQNGAELFLNSKVTAIERIDAGYRVRTSSGSFEAKYVLNASGTHGDTIHNMIAEPEFKITPIRGQYYLLDKSEGTRVNHVIFQCPTKKGKGVLVAPTVHGNLIAGPDSEDVPDRENTATTSYGLSHVMNAARKSIASINFRESVRNFSGVRAASDHPDFILAESKTAKGFYDIAGIKSPGLSAAPAIAKMAAGLLQEAGLALKEKEDYCKKRKKIRFNDLPIEEKNRLIIKNPAYGRVICRCETVTEGEIINALHSPIIPHSIDGVKRRCNAGMGRCQGGFCGPRVLEIMSRELKLPPEKIVQDKEESIVIIGETKAGGLTNV